MDKPLVSIIVPAYNAEKYIGAAIESVQAQTYKEWELIIVLDEGSNDRTAEVATEFSKKDKRVICYPNYHQRMAAARNFGIRKARGKYVAFLDADNLFLPDKLKKQVAFMEKHLDCGVCYSRIFHFYDNHPEKLYENKNEIHELPQNFFEKILRNNFINVLSVLIRKDALDNFGAFPEGWHACDEHYLWVNLACNKVKFAPLDIPVGLLRLHYSNDSKRSDHLYNTALLTLALLNIVESRFSLEEKKQWRKHISRLRWYWRWLLFLGKLLANPFTSRFLMPIYLWRRQRAYYIKI